MDVSLPLDQMSLEEKLRAMELIWEDLCRTAEAVPSPRWHEEVLRTREERITRGTARFVDWSEAKKRLRDPGS
ncbi:MAG: hypothetical protein D6739_03050 [Nitrospirae bacterium]|nr:MAG: hypothetical protein D6739_03050 [Nitrospirota bacterium]